MFWDLIITSLGIISSVLSGVVQSQSLCGSSEFPCTDGTCVSVQRVCDGVGDCTDNSDETACVPGANSTLLSLLPPNGYNRRKRQSGCGEEEFQCHNKACIQFYQQCDGIRHCNDGSDETHPHCRNFTCPSGFFRCTYGACISGSAPCNGIQECADNSDELVPRCRNGNKIHKGRFVCHNGELVAATSLCDGKRDCEDGTDETLPTCADKQCDANLFQCAYGACVRGDSVCNGNQECVDGSDESDELCNRTTAVVQPPLPLFTEPIISIPTRNSSLAPVDEHNRRKWQLQYGNYFMCRNGQQVITTALCNGTLDCKDGTDETLSVCADTKCAFYSFKCAYGACIDRDLLCNGKQECVDGSDESNELCSWKTTSGIPLSLLPSTTTTPPSFGACELPRYPDNGRYQVRDQPLHRPGQLFTGVVFVNVTCDPGYAPDGNTALHLLCYPEIELRNIIPLCKRYCTLPPHHSVDYECETRKDGATVRRPCGHEVFIGTTVVPMCRPNYRGSPAYMHCTQDGWNYIAKCASECGRTTPQGQEYIIGGRRAVVGEIPWHAAIYAKTFKPFMQICGGSIVTIAAVITAAHCFWKDGEGKQSPELYSVAVGKIYRPWADDHDVGAQFSNIIEIHMPDRFRGSETNFQHDIAIVILETKIVYKPYIRPVCVSYDFQFNSRQLMAGNLGKISGWGLTASNGGAAQVLKVVELPFVTYNKCYEDAPIDFREYITGDKICAGFQNGTALCQGDSGGGLAFPEYELGVQRHYLRGIVSTAPRSDGLVCDPFQRTTFTELTKHESWIKGLLYIEGT